MEAHEAQVDHGSIADFLSREWGRPTILQNKKFYEWQFKGHPLAKGNDRSLVAIKGNEIIGYVGVNESLLHLNGSSILAGQYTTWVVSEEERGWLGMKMIDALKKKYSALISMGISVPSLPIHLRLGFQYCKSIPRFIYVANRSKVKEICSFDPAYGGFLEKRREKISMAEGSLTESNVFNGEEYLRGLNHYDRGDDFLNWRYIEHPYFQHQVLRFTFNGKQMTFILRTDSANSLKIAHIMELLGDLSILPECIMAIEEYVKNVGIDLIDVYNTSSEICAYFWRMGWLSTNDDVYVRVPHLFHPIELREPPTTSMILWSKVDMHHYLNLPAMYLTKGDCDLDRPTPSLLEMMGVEL